MLAVVLNFCKEMNILPSFELPKGNDLSYGSFIESVQQLLEQVLPKEVMKFRQQPEQFFEVLAPYLPFICWSQIQEGGLTVGVTVLSKAEYSHGTGRFVSDALCRRLIPGKIVELGGTRTLSFYFFPNDTREYLINERWVVADDAKTLELIRRNLPILTQELRLTLLSISRARHFLSLKSHTLGGKDPLMEELQHVSTFEEMHGIIKRLSAEKTVAEIRDYITPFYQKRPKVFDRDIFESIKPFVSIYDEKFVGTRKLQFIARLICYHFYFKKLLEERSTKEPLLRHVLLKIMKRENVLGVIVCVNLFGDNEVLKKQHLIDIIGNCLLDVEEVKGSFFMDMTSEHQPLLYLEIEKKNKNPFSAQEITFLRNKLPLELKECIQSVFNPLFMLRNDEDHMRHIIALSHELRYVKDIPQVVITFEEQTKEGISFSVVLLRVLKEDTLNFKKILSLIPFKTHLRELKNIGWIRNKYPKEAAIFKVSLPKSSFLRKDRSLDLPKARQVLLAELNRLFEDIRDYNGGLLSKQLETLQQLKWHLGSVAKEYTFSLENFFFSLEPLTVQTTMNAHLLKEGFLLLLTLIRDRSSYKTQCFQEGICAAFIISSTESKESLIAFLETARMTFYELCYSLTHIQDFFCLTIFLVSQDLNKQKEFEDLLISFAESKILLKTS
jgi:hypothetical protein